MRRAVVVALAGIAIAACGNEFSETASPSFEYEAAIASTPDGLPPAEAAPIRGNAQMRTVMGDEEVQTYFVVDGVETHVLTSVRFDTSNDPGCQPAGVARCSSWRSPVWAVVDDVIAYGVTGERSVNLLADGSIMAVALQAPFEVVSTDGTDFYVRLLGSEDYVRLTKGGEVLN